MKKQKIFTIGILLLGLFFWQSERSLTELVVENFLETPVAVASTQKTYQLKSQTQVGMAWGELAVNFDFIEEGGYQFAAYYGEDGYMTVSGKRLEETTWITKRLTNVIGCDSHNGVKIAIDKNGHIHVSGNMHTSPLRYYRSSNAYDVSSLEYISGGMIGQDETSTTYPVFMKDKNGELLFTYRQGGSGDGVNYINRFDVNSRTWSRVTSQPIFASAVGTANAYPTEYVLGEDGYFHVAAMWRQTTSASTNYQISYAKTADFRNFLKSNGQSIILPITQLNAEAVESLQNGDGLINAAYWLHYIKTSHYNGPMLFYHKYENNFSQLFMAYLSNGTWVKKKLTNLNCKWDFTGLTGSLANEIGEIDLTLDGDQINYSYWYSFSNCSSSDKKGTKTAKIDTQDFSVVETNNYVYPYKFPSGLNTKESTVSEVVVRSKVMLSTSRPTSNLHYIKWETLPGNNDQCWNITAGPSRLIWNELEEEANLPSCGTADKTCSLTEPTTNLCSSGTVNDFALYPNTTYPGYAVGWWGWNCGGDTNCWTYQTASCGDDLCASGYEYNSSTAKCEEIVVSPNCASETCQGNSCWDGQVYIPGTKTVDCATVSATANPSSLTAPGTSYLKWSTVGGSKMEAACLSGPIITERDSWFLSNAECKNSGLMNGCTENGYALAFGSNQTGKEICTFYPYNSSDGKPGIPTLVEINANAYSVNCGTAARTYAATETGWGSYTFCSAGTAEPTNPTFPATGDSTTWICDDEIDSYCTATRSSGALQSGGKSCRVDNPGCEVPICKDLYCFDGCEYIQGTKDCVGRR